MKYEVAKSLTVAHYRNEHYPIYSYADHAYTALTFICLLVALSYLVMFNPSWVWFMALFVVSFFGGAIHGRYEVKWVWEWMKNDPMQELVVKLIEEMKNPIIGDKP
jgi:hypothetical protein